MGDFASQRQPVDLTPGRRIAQSQTPGRRTPGGVELPRAIPRGLHLPGAITSDHADPKGISSRRVRFDRQGIAYDGTSYTGITIAANTAWNRVGGSTGHMYLQLGSFAYDAIIYAWGGFSWANNDAGTFTGRVCLVLYDYDGTSYNVVKRADNYFPEQRLPNDGSFVAFNGFTQFILPADSGGDFWIGMQAQNAGSTSHIAQSARDQTLMAFAVALDPEQASNLSTDATLE